MMNAETLTRMVDETTSQPHAMFFLGICAAASMAALCAALRSMTRPAADSLIEHPRIHAATRMLTTLILTSWTILLIAAATGLPLWSAGVAALASLAALSTWWMLSGARVWMVGRRRVVDSPLGVNVGDYILASRRGVVVLRLARGVAEQFESNSFEFDTDLGTISSSTGWVFLVAWRVV